MTCHDWINKYFQSTIYFNSTKIKCISSCAAEDLQTKQSDRGGTTEVLSTCIWIILTTNISHTFLPRVHTQTFIFIRSPRFYISFLLLTLSFVPRLGQHNVNVFLHVLRVSEKGDRGQTQINLTELDNVRSIHMRVHTLDGIYSLFITSLLLSWPYRASKHH